MSTVLNEYMMIYDIDVVASECIFRGE